MTTPTDKTARQIAAYRAATEAAARGDNGAADQRWHEFISLVMRDMLEQEPEPALGADGQTSLPLGVDSEGGHPD